VFSSSGGAGVFEESVLPSDIVLDQRMSRNHNLVSNGNDADLVRTILRNPQVQLLENIVRLHTLHHLRPYTQKYLHKI
jgi:hypothetical protein